MSSKLGLRMDGVEDRFIELFLAAARGRGDQPFHFFELGTATAITYSVLWQHLQEANLAAHATMVSCDLPDGWSVEYDKMKANMDKAGKWWLSYKVIEPRIGAQIYFVDGRALISRLHTDYGFYPDFAFIDGCHGRACAMADFEAIAPTVRQGGLVVFHDACELSQHTDMQDHCKERINVRQGIRDLGLLDNTRAGWRLVEEIAGDRPRGGEGNGCLVVQRV